MARGLSRIWVRFGLAIAATVLVTMAVLGTSVVLSSQWQYRNFQSKLPPNVREEIDTLQRADLQSSPRALEIYSRYWGGDPLFGEKWTLISLLVCLPFGLVGGFWVSRQLTQPLASMAEAAQRIALGDFSVRAEPVRVHGEMAEMVRHFNQMTDALEQLERERKATAAAISHELRTPLAVLRARLHAVCDGVIPADLQESGKLLEQVEHLGRLVDDLHTLSMADAGRLSLQIQELDLVALARDTLADYASRLALHQIKADLRSAQAQVLVHADKDRMRQVLLNLVENALRHAHVGGWLEVALQPQTDADGKRWALLSVSDAGPGLPEDVRRHVFQRFQRCDNSRSRATGGSGLGLSIVHTLVARQGGSISVAVSARGGTCFTVRLPCKAPSSRGAASS